MSDAATIAAGLTKAQRTILIDARWHEWTKSWRLIVSGQTEKILRMHGLIDDRAFAALTDLGLAVRAEILATKKGADHGA